MDLSKVEKPLVLYHAPCRDGWCAAFLAKLRWDAELVGQQYGDPVEFDEAEGFYSGIVTLLAEGEKKDFDLRDRDVLILDFSYPRDTLARMHGMARSLLVLDHHSTAKKDLEGLDYAVFDMERSGAGLALDHFFPGARAAFLDGRHAPAAEPLGFHWTEIAILCERWDLWKHDDYVRSVCAFLDTLPREIGEWLKAPPVRDMKDRGSAVLAYQKQQVERIVKHAHLVSWPFGSGIVVSAVNSPVLQSEVGQALYEKDPQRASLVWYRNERMETICSLRSAKEGPDVSEMARKFGGGGHRNAAGFKLLPNEHENAAWLWHAADRAGAKA